MITEPGRPPIEYRSTASEVVIGRSPSCEVVVDRPFVSGRHLRVLGGVVAHDLGSTNGTFLDGRLLERPELIVSRTLRLGGGEVEVRVITDRADASALVSAAAPETARGGDEERQSAALLARTRPSTPP